MFYLQHEDYEVGPGQAPNDLAVIQFTAVSITDNVRPITLASTDDWTDSECWITGWGYISEYYCLFIKIDM